MSEFNIQQPATIFTDTQLRDIADQLPTGILAFLQVTKMTDERFEQYGRRFLEICKKHAVQSL
ncbi:uncharacterized protein BYT42DRAFT_587823 [Radiomyces spectabilis]|uniref:uncharacterized protein n=1 Tax=Radiomyces spectabilis TaxID=64574 RepID=UPI00221F78E9|nr:uncharacterized protein BYT42DRAFT_587823 [Radiomyces spectabilis]KAI8366770.1 hypothetical protein BYT42DRAFT_587823 [Radiomyces spectabilis]